VAPAADKPLRLGACAGWVSTGWQRRSRARGARTAKRRGLPRREVRQQRGKRPATRPRRARCARWVQRRSHACAATSSAWRARWGRRPSTTPRQVGARAHKRFEASASCRVPMILPCFSRLSQLRLRHASLLVACLEQHRWSFVTVPHTSCRGTRPRPRMNWGRELQLSPGRRCSS
jgi:hypothetical protein